MTESWTLPRIRQPCAWLTSAPVGCPSLWPKPWEFWADNPSRTGPEIGVAPGQGRARWGCLSVCPSKQIRYLETLPKRTRRTETDITRRSHIATSTGALTALNEFGSAGNCREKRPCTERVPEVWVN